MQQIARFVLDPVCFLPTSCSNMYRPSSHSQLKATITMKTNLSSELCPLVIEKKRNDLLGAHLDHRLFCWLIAASCGLQQCFSKGSLSSAADKDLQALRSLGGWLLTQGNCKCPHWGSSHCGGMIFLWTSLQMLPELQPD